MPKTIEKLLLFTIDFITVNVAFWALMLIRKSAHLFVETNFWLGAQISTMIFVFWFLLFLFYGGYQSWYTQSRFDEILTMIKAISVGIFLIFVFTFEPEKDLSQAPTLGRMMILTYWFIMVFFVSTGRFILHSIQRKMLEAGIGQRNTFIIGWNDQARELADKIKSFPALGYKVVGFISLEKKHTNEQHDNIPVLGTLSKVKNLVKKHNIEEIIFAIGKTTPNGFLKVLAHCEGLPVHLKIQPDLYDTVLGHARTNQIYGFPLIEIHPNIMPEWEARTKRLIDLFCGLFGLIVLSPIMILVSIIIKLESRGPILFRQKRVGKDGKVFTVLKFRSMVQDAEKLTGPVWAGEKDPRVTRTGRIMRKLRIDEFPQLFNVLSGSMSLVGPRPERPYFVDKLKREYPLYTRRLRVKPGVTGWAQVKGEYDTTIEKVKEKLDYDLYYIDNLSLRLDFRIMIYTVMVMIKGKGQ